MNVAIITLLVVVAVLAGTAVGWWLHGRRETVPAPVPAAGADGVARRLVEQLILLHDQGDAPDTRARITDLLATADVTPVAATAGAVFDPNHHRAIDSRPAATPCEADTIAALVRPGWIAPTGVLRPAEVVVLTRPAPIGGQV
ncbi:nucleotide exchange factor GrpE [Aldersonia sp. NBC_00410]|uniref:nucleotide exchange factor GrpE n=1 Tax=Aldersonia sp. NBC_00410 TaxID=2975954 RepID=UPI0022518E02|nr:nucleotide exchange factor GrpE [Aldersonia sp. NBC_00410]MCX5046655.1 nucleotide exchange factor GrpE [Aldersonia sp. NBC_00410]